mgnify:CR=1 FL=1
MAELNFGGVIETVMTREEFPLEKVPSADERAYEGNCGYYAERH